MCWILGGRESDSGTRRWCRYRRASHCRTKKWQVETAQQDDELIVGARRVICTDK